MNDVFTRIQAFNQGRDPYLIQLKYRAMQSDVFAFLRGTCHLFYQDWPSASPLNVAPITCICGDLHLQNLGSYKGDNRLVYFNINDFDEAALAPCTWDLARFLTCLLVAALDLGISEAKALALGKLFLKVYAKTLTRGRVRYLDNDDAVGPARALLFQVQKRARADFLDAHTQHADGARHLLVNGKQADPATAAERDAVTALMQKWSATQLNPQFYTVLDVARRIAGVGSLGVERYMLLVEGKGSPDRNYLLDLKAETDSSLQPYLTGEQPHWSNQAERAVTIQRWVQGIPPALLAPVELGGKYYALRELQPIEDKVNLALLRGKYHRLEQLVTVIAQLVAWGQLRSAGRQNTADAPALMSFARASSDWRAELLSYARSYAAQVNADYQEFCAALKAK